MMNRQAVNCPPKANPEAMAEPPERKFWAVKVTTGVRPPRKIPRGIARRWGHTPGADKKR